MQYVTKSPSHEVTKVVCSPAKDLVTFKEAREWASTYLGRKVTSSNITYLIQYAKIHLYDEKGNLKTSVNGTSMVSLQELKEYYDRSRKELRWKELLGEDINWVLSFEEFTESERTKHVHRLHPYKGKFIPQLVEYFLDSHANDLKDAAFFHEGDIILDPFVGSGTTLVQCLELGLHSIGIDISKFNCMISEVKVRKYELDKLDMALGRAARMTEAFSEDGFWYEHENSFDKLLASFKEKYYPNPEFKFLLGSIRELEGKIEDEIDELCQGSTANRKTLAEEVLNRNEDQIISLEKKIADFAGRNLVPLQFSVSLDNIENLGNEFADKYAELVLQELNKRTPRHKQTKLDIISVEPFVDSRFLSRWFTERQRAEMRYYSNLINSENDPKVQDVMKIILSRTVRSCRATKHIDLATLIKPQTDPYYCRKHFTICKPATTIIRHLKRYSDDTIKRIREFESLRKNVFCEVINDDSRTVDIFDFIANKNDDFGRLLTRRKIDGIFTSPPYVGQIDYHQQHAYSYELFGIERKDELEIGKQSNGTGRKAQSDYIEGISAVLLNIERFLKKDAHIFVVANDSKNLYNTIAEASGLEIVKVFKRPVLNRTERDKQPYSESIFHMMFS